MQVLRNLARTRACLALAVCFLAAHVQAQSPLKGITYSPFWENAEQFCRPQQLVSQDLNILRGFTRRIRIYSINACPASTRQILDFARSNGMTVLVGLFFNQDLNTNEAEVNALPALLRDYDASVINSISVGNEPISIEGLSTSYITGLIQRVRQQLQQAGRTNIPVTVIENFPSWQPGSSVSNALLPLVDFVGINLHPYFEGVPVSCQGTGLPSNQCEDAALWTINRAKALRTSYNKNVIVTETGWPTFGERASSNTPFGFPSNSPRFMAVPSIPNSQAYLNRFSSLAQQEGIDYYYFEMFDGTWKRIYAICKGFCPFLDSCVNGYCTYDYNWGLYDSNRQPKCGLTVPSGSGPLPSSPPPLAAKPSPSPPPLAASPSPSPPPLAAKPSPPPPAGSLPAGYVLIQQPISAFQEPFTICQNRGQRFTSYLNPNIPAGDKAAVDAALRIVPRLYVNDNTVNGQCPVVSAVNTVRLENCFQSLPFVCGPNA